MLLWSFTNGAKNCGIHFYVIKCFFSLQGESILRYTCVEYQCMTIWISFRLLDTKEEELNRSKIRESKLARQIHELRCIVQRGVETQVEPKDISSFLLALNEWFQLAKA